MEVQDLYLKEKLVIILLPVQPYISISTTQIIVAGSIIHYNLMEDNYCHKDDLQKNHRPHV